jgi:hypothetical protein
VRRTLLSIRAFNEAARALVIQTALYGDLSHRSQDAKERQHADDMMGLLTPVVKGVLTDIGFANTVNAQQMFGGHGYISEWGMEQFVRDARIPMIYEGANGIQALDLVARKLPRDQGATLRAMIATAREADPRLAPAAAELEHATRWILAAAPEEAAASASACLDACGWFLGAAQLARAARLDARYAPIAAFYRARLLPRVQARCSEITGAAELLALIA